MAAPLDGIRVVDFSRVLAGPFCAKTLQDLGAQVTKIEPPRGDVSRVAAPINANGVSGYYAQQNAGKRNLSIDLADEGIIVGLINPGLVDTRGFADMLAGKKPTPPEFAQIVTLLETGVIQLSTPEEAVTQMRTLIANLSPEQSGVFLNAGGAPLPW